MSYSLEQILGFVPLTEALRTKASGVPNPFPAEFFKADPANRVLGDRARYVRISGERRTAKRVKYGAPAIRRSLRDIGDQDVRMLHEHESFPIDFVMLQKLRSFERYQQDEGMDWLRYQIDEAAHRVENARIITVASALSNGAIYWDSNGNLLPNSSGANSDFTISFSVPATHLNQINGIIDASWALANTDIPTHINKIQRFSLEETGLRLNACMYGVNVPKYIRQNNFCQAFLSRNPGMNEKMVTTNQIPDGLFDIEKWIPVYTSFYESDDNATISEMFTGDTATFVPNVDQPNKMTWWAMFEGSMPVCRSLEVSRNALAAMNQFELVYGMGAYAVPTVSPPQMEVYQFDTFLPCIRNEKAIFIATVAF